ncbi:collagen-like protein [Streptomyces phaeochromogenes]|uniref:collagen-like protein n=1 Tax=Streptomyces phaeochromogenes TaxID=1923 RepID=UPI0036B4199D
MTRTEIVLYRNRRLLLLVAILLTLGGGVALSLLLIHKEVDARQNLAHEADLRGTAVSTLAGDVRALRAQVQARGGTPVAPDPSRAVEDLPDRAEVPVPIPGPPGPKGDPGKPGTSGPSGSPGQNGESGSDGADGSAGTVGPAGPQGDPGPAGPQGEPGPAGADGRDGVDGRDGQTCPDGYSLQAPADDPDALVCRRDSAPDPGDDDPSNPLAAALDPQRRTYA